MMVSCASDILRVCDLWHSESPCLLKVRTGIHYRLCIILYPIILQSLCDGMQCISSVCCAT